MNYRIEDLPTDLLTLKCRGAVGGFVNDYYIDMEGLVRNSRQYQGEKIGYMTIARLDRTLQQLLHEFPSMVDHNAQ